MADIRYSKDHEWVRREGEDAVIGITDYAQNQLGDVVYVELPAVGRALEQGGDAAVVESVKAASEVYAPVAGTVTAVNELLSGEPGRVNADPEGEGWFFRVKLSEPKQLDGLMDAAAYKSFVEGLA
jgi:glycine cleavage system H protein